MSWHLYSLSFPLKPPAAPAETGSPPAPCVGPAAHLPSTKHKIRRDIINITSLWPFCPILVDLIWAFIWKDVSRYFFKRWQFVTEPKPEFLLESLTECHQSWQSHQRGFCRGSSSELWRRWVEGSWVLPLCAACTWIKWCALPAPGPLMHCDPKLWCRTDRGVTSH